jgi:DNA-directed RNA polymerase subunit RPC12/RpoP
VTIELSCSQCGSNRFTLAKAARDESEVSCEDCGHRVGTLGELKQAVADRVLGG